MSTSDELASAATDVFAAQVRLSDANAAVIDAQRNVGRALASYHVAATELRIERERLANELALANEATP